jgi:hypothetical protein
MTIRKRNDSVKPGCGIDGSEGENYTKKSGNPWDSNPAHDFMSPKGRGPYQNAGSGLTNKQQNGGSSDMSDGIDILDLVESNQSDSGNRGIKPRGGR